MPRIFYIIIVAAILVAEISCQKNNAAQPNGQDRSKVLIGTWELRRVRAMYVYTYQPGNGNKVVFSDTAFTTYVNGVLNKQGHYDIIRDNSVSESVCLSMPIGEYENRLVYDSNYQSQKIFFEVTSDSLITVSGCFSVDQGAFNEFVRVK